METDVFEFANENVHLICNKEANTLQEEHDVLVFSENNRKTIKAMRHELIKSFVVEYKKMALLRIGDECWSLKLDFKQEDTHPDYILDVIDKAVSAITVKEDNIEEDSVVKRESRKLINELFPKVKRGLRTLVCKDIPEIPSYKSTKEENVTKENFINCDTYINEDKKEENHENRVEAESTSEAESNERGYRGGITCGDYNS